MLCFHNNISLCNSERAGRERRNQSAEIVFYNSAEIQPQRQKLEPRNTYSTKTPFRLILQKQQINAVLETLSPLLSHILLVPTNCPMV